jgi:hypothetical protein
MALPQYLETPGGKKAEEELPTRKGSPPIGVRSKVGLLLMVGVAAALAASAMAAGRGSSPELASPAKVAFSPDNLISLIRESRAQCALPPEGQLVEAAKRVSAAEEHLVTALSGLPDGETLKRGLGLPLLRSRREAAAPPSGDDMESIYRQLTDGRAGLERSEIRPFREAVLCYGELLRAQANPDLLAESRRQLLQLEEAWRSYTGTKSNGAMDQLRAPYRWLARHHQAKEVLSSVRRRVSYPNQFLRVSGALVHDATVTELKRTLEFNEAVTGTQLQGSAVVSGVIRLGLRPSRNTV